VGAIGVVAAFVFIVAMLLLAIIYHNRRLIHKETVCDFSVVAIIIVQCTFMWQSRVEIEHYFMHISIALLHS